MTKQEQIKEMVEDITAFIESTGMQQLYTSSDACCQSEYISICDRYNWLLSQYLIEKGYVKVSDYKTYIDNKILKLSDEVELVRRLVAEGIKPPMPKLLGNKKCKDFHGDCSSCPLTYLNNCYLDNDDNSNYTLFEIVEYRKEELGYLYEPIMAKLNEEVQ